MKSVALLVLLFAAACTKKNPEACCTTQEDCDAIGLPVGSDCGDDLMCLGNRCVATTTCQAPSDCPSATPQCNPDGVCVECLETSECGSQVCGEGGQCVACIANEECDTGFCSEGLCRNSIIPKYLPTVCDVETDAELQLTEDFDTDDGTNCTQILSQGAGLPDICIVHAKTILINGTVAVSGSRALALVADRSISVEGTLDAGGKGRNPGPGVTATSGTAATSGGDGGGGAGFQTKGGNGGSAADTAGVAVEDPAALSTLSGGFTAGGANAGGGGGGVTLIACRGSVSISGLIDVSGGGGQGGTASPVVAGRGGGSGGYLVLQGVAIDITGQVFSNGGAGGGGAIVGSTNADGGPGEDGARSTTTQAVGGIAGNSQIVSGGEGGIVGMAPKAGTNRRTVSGNSVTGGGGGGSMGFLQTYTPRQITPQLGTAVTSPAFQANLELSTR